MQKNKPDTSQKTTKPDDTQKFFIERDLITRQDQSQYTKIYFPTNNVMLDPVKKVCYLPAYMRLKFKNFNDLDIGRLSAILNGEIVLVIFYGELFKNLSQKQTKSIIENELMQKIVLLFARDNAIKLTSDDQENEDKELDIKVSHDPEKREIKFVVKKLFTLFLDSEIFLTPFEVINGILEVTVQSIKVNFSKSLIEAKDSKDSKDQDWKVQFNLQNNWNIEEKVQFANWGQFGNYDLAQKRIGALYTNYRISSAKDFTVNVQQRIKIQKEKKGLTEIKSGSEEIIDAIKNMQKKKNPGEQVQNQRYNYGESEKDFLTINVTEQDPKVEAFHYAYFNIPLYKYPLSAIITIFTPLFFLDVLNFGILFQDKGLSDRIAAIATLVLAFAALIPTIRSQIPPNPKITLIQILVYAQTAPTILSIIQSLNVSYNTVEDTFVQDWMNDGFFWVAFIISIASLIIILTLITIHYCYWYPSYNEVADRKKKPNFNRLLWRNTQCNICFGEYFHQKKHQYTKTVVLTAKHYQHSYKVPKKTVDRVQKMLMKEKVGQEIIGKMRSGR